jgi:hypothetical protein
MKVLNPCLYLQSEKIRIHIIVNKRIMMSLLYPGRGLNVTVKHSNRFLNIKSKLGIRSDCFDDGDGKSDGDGVVLDFMFTASALLRDSATKNTMYSNDNSKQPIDESHTAK